LFPAPVVLGMVIGDTVIRDVETGKPTLVGIFNRINAQVFPAVHPILHVFVSVTEGRGEGRARLELVEEKTQQVVNSLEVPVRFPPDPTEVADLNFRLAKIAFPRPGSYRFNFVWAGEVVGSRRFKVGRHPAPTTG